MIWSIEGAGEKRINHGQYFLGRQQAGADHRDLAFEHFGQVLDGRLATPLREAHQVVGVVQPRGSAIGADAVIGIGAACRAKIDHRLHVYGRFP